MPPIVGGHPKALILGTMPSVISDQMKQYYANPRNDFWRVIHGIWYKEPDTEYEYRQDFLKSHGLALWDVIHECDIRDSDDGSIKNVIVNDFEGFFRDHPSIGHIFLNGNKANREYSKQVNRRLVPELRRPVMCLPSTSPANTIGYQKKLEAWRIVRAYIESQ